MGSQPTARLRAIFSVMYYLENFPASQNWCGFEPHVSRTINKRPANLELLSRTRRAADAATVALVQSFFGAWLYPDVNLGYAAIFN